MDYKKLYEAAKLLKETCKSFEACMDCPFDDHGDCCICALPSSWGMVEPDADELSCEK